ncbi:MAG TPA: hypothetical protein VN041_13995 [Microbacterium sp.]|nr:hypothetical protein [Microbacterium sp.]
MSKFQMIPSAVAAAAAWDEGVQSSGSFEITDLDLMVLSAASRREIQSELVERSHAAGYVLEWRRDHPRATVVFTWRRIGDVRKTSV